MYLTIFKYAAIILAAFFAGTIFQAKVLQPKINIPACPVVTVPPCPPQTAVSLQNFDLDKLNNKKGTFYYQPQLHNVQVIIEAKDSVMLKQLLKQSLK